MECPGTPSRVLLRSRIYFEENMNVILQQERFHAASKKPRRAKFVIETDSKLEKMSDAVQNIRKRVATLSVVFRNMTGKVNRLDVIKEQACFFMTPQRVLSSGSDGMISRSPMKLTYSPPPTEYSSSSDQGYSSPLRDNKVVEYFRKKNLLNSELDKVLKRSKKEQAMLDEIYQSNANILRFKRAEKSLIKIIRVQSKLRTLNTELEGLKERLCTDNSSDNSYLLFNE